MMEDLEGQEAAPTTESKISLVRKYRLILHVFRGRECQAEVQMWEMVGSNARASDNINPYLLQYENASLIENHLFSLRMIVDGVAEYFPYATHEKLGFLGQLPNWGFKRVDTYGKSSSNETTEPPAKEKHSALKNFSVMDDGISNEELRQRLSGAIDTLIEQHNALYDACEKAQHFIDREDWHSDHATFAVLQTLAAALTKAGKK